MLIIHLPTDPQSRYSHFLLEILRSEGYADIESTTFAQINAEELMRHDLVMLPRSALAWEEIDLLANYVAAGGVLFAFQPDYQLVRRFGLEPVFGGAAGQENAGAPAWERRHLGGISGSATNTENAGRDAGAPSGGAPSDAHGGYIPLAGHRPVYTRMVINTNFPALAALCAEPVDVVVPTVHWRIGDGTEATPLATLTQEGSEFGAIHAALLVPHGQGKTVLFAYDLPHAVARLRQGDPGNADLGLTYCDDANRPNELFVGQLDPAHLHLPQADIHTALLARVIDTVAPRPRLWYYPAPAQQSAVVMTSDEDWSTLEQWQSLIAGLRQRQAQCTFFMVAESRIEKRWVDEWESEGHVFSVHPALTSDYTRGLPKPPHHRHFMAQMLRDNVERHKSEYKRPVNTIRQHRVRWIGYVECAQLEADLGVAMDCNYMAVKPYHIGYMAGSGRTLPFVETDGRVLPCYQLAAQWSEECLIHDTMYISLKWPAERAIAVATRLVREAATRFYTPICFNSHPVSYHTYSSPLTDSAWDQAVELGVPIVSADHWLAWTQARDGVTLERNDHGFTLTSSKPVPSLVLLLPPGLRAEIAGASQQEVALWGEKYTALTLTNVSAGTRLQVMCSVK